ACAQGLCRRHARRHRQCVRRGVWRHPARTIRGSGRGLSLIAVQGRGGIYSDPPRSLCHAARIIWQGAARAGVMTLPFVKRLLPVGAMTAVVIALPLFFPSAYYYRLAALVFVFAIVVLGCNLLMVFAGQVSLGHAGFMGIGAYAVAIGPTHLGAPTWLSLIVGAAISALLGLLVGRPILRLRGHYLAVATLGFGLLLAIVFTNEARFTGGPDGMTVPRLVLFGYSVWGAQSWYWIIAASFFVGAVLALKLIESPTGRALPAIHHSR